MAIEAGDLRTRQFDYLACWCDGGQRGTSRGRGIAVRARIDGQGMLGESTELLGVSGVEVRDQFGCIGRDQVRLCQRIRGEVDACPGAIGQAQDDIGYRYRQSGYTVLTSGRDDRRVRITVTRSGKPRNDIHRRAGNMAQGTGKHESLTVRPGYVDACRQGLPTGPGDGERGWTADGGEQDGFATVVQQANPAADALARQREHCVAGPGDHGAGPVVRGFLVRSRHRHNTLRQYEPPSLH